ncbi:hypothetical protein SPRG_13349 [Saprolegnia parasitica CBS 223.65]|uniref:Uncharacterized protein n=1 Tax=Saprolegnia parasitica (strain CBS 223.65) TaxID=695850 RepID=A0A067BXF2_SAPPC|nr:hypothetical protein SPRG_13349 [Saprolegnia parasitica CBS 223.65]KDO21540.1 hypothetical protein SPRG_13349 [Saprolegnia parasitica CBS 223.65]|eukprot:XP_012207719.1 hypothetical protein SPRG_13349 [Saprolegnia parasitica CBS 223.65]
MNPLLFLYLNLVRGPQIAAERQRKEAEAAQAANPAPAPVEAKEVVMASCKNLCVACASDPMSMLSPVFIFQILLILFALAVFIYRSL